MLNWWKVNSSRYPTSLPLLQTFWSHRLGFCFNEKWDLILCLSSSFSWYHNQRRRLQSYVHQSSLKKSKQGTVLKVWQLTVFWFQVSKEPVFIEQVFNPLWKHMCKPLKITNNKWWYRNTNESKWPYSASLPWTKN